MTAKTFPEGWHIISGTIGTDIDVTTTVGQYQTGGCGFIFYAGQSATIVSDWIPITGVTEVDNLWEIYVVAKHSGVLTHSQYVSVAVEAASEDKATVDTIAVYAQETSAIWRCLGSGQIDFTDRPWGRVRISSQVTTRDLYLDRVYINPCPAYLAAGAYAESGADTISGSFTSSWANVDFSSCSNSLHSNSRLSALTTADAVGIYKPGTYSVYGCVQVNNACDDGDIFGARVGVLNDNSGAKYIYGTALTIPASYTPLTPLATRSIHVAVSGLLTIDGSFLSAFGEEGFAPEPTEIVLQVIQHAGTGGTYTNATLKLARIPGE